MPRVKNHLRSGNAPLTLARTFLKRLEESSKREQKVATIHTRHRFIIEGSKRTLANALKSTVVRERNKEDN